MISQIIQEYLVKLGADVDKQQFQKFDQQLDHADKKVASTTGSMAKNIEKGSVAVVKTTAKAGKEVAKETEKAGKAVIHTTKEVGSVMIHTSEGVVSTLFKASMTIGTIFMTVSLASAKMMKSLTDQDLQMETFANRMMMTKNAAWQMKKATDALGASVQDIIINPELMDRYKALVADSSKMMPNQDFEATMKGFRDLTFEVTRFKQEVSFGMQWVAYYIIKGLIGPLDVAHQKMKNINDYIITHMQEIAQRVASAIIYVIHVLQECWECIKKIKDEAWSLWESFPPGVKMAIEALGALWLVFRASPIEKMIALFGLLFHAMNGGGMGGLQETIEGVQSTIVNLVRIAAPYIEMFVGLLVRGAEIAIETFEAFLPILLKVVNFVVWGVGIVLDLFEALLPTFEKIGEIVMWVADRFMVLVNNVVPQLIDVWDKFMDLLSPLLDKLMALIDDVLPPLEVAFSRLIDIVSQVADVVLELIDALWPLISDIFKTLADVIVWIVDKLGELADALSDLSDSFKGSGALQEFTVCLEDIGGAFKELASGWIGFVTTYIKEFLKGMGDTGNATSFSSILHDLWEVFLWLGHAIAGVVRWVGRFFEELSRSPTVRTFMRTVGELAGTVWELLRTIVKLIFSALRPLFGEFSNNKPTHLFQNALLVIVKVITMMLNVVIWLIKRITQLFKTVSQSEGWMRFWKETGKIVKDIGEIIDNVLGRIGKLAEAISALIHGDYKKAAMLAKQAVFGSWGSYVGGGPLDSQMWGIAQQIGAETGINPQFIYGQMYHETGGFTSDLAKENNNFGGLKGEDGEYMSFSSPEDFGKYYASYLSKYEGLSSATTPEEYASALKSGGYYEDSVENYTAGIESGMQNIPVGTVSTDTSNIPEQSGVDISDVDPQLLQTTDGLLQALMDEGYQNVQISSGYRSPDHSVAVGGYADDPHTQGRAIDFVSDGDPNTIVAAGAARGLSITYHDAGSGYHYHAQMADDDGWGGPPANAASNFDASHAGMPSMGQMLGSHRRGIGALTEAAMGVLQQLCANVDPALLSMATSDPTFNVGGSPSITIQVGDINIMQPNATAPEISEQVLGRIEKRAQYFLTNRALNGSPELK